MNRIIHYLCWLPLLTTLFVTSGCTSEERVDQEKEHLSSLTFTLETPKENIGTRAMNGMAEQTIKSLDILVFKEVVSGQEVFDYKISVPVSSISSGATRSFTTDVKSQNTDQRFVLIANAANLINTLSAAGQAKDDVLKELTVRQPGKWNATSSTNFDPIPMWGETPLMTVISSGSSTGTIYLHRMLAKINVAIAPSITTTTFSLEEVYLYNRSTRGRLVPDLSSANWNPGGPHNGEALNSTLPLDNIPSDPLTILSPTWKYDKNTDGVTATGVSNTIYTFETKADNTDPLKEFALVIGGKYNGSQTSYYRVDFKDASKTGYIDILRNHNYMVTIDAVGGNGAGNPGDAFKGGITLDATVAAWNAADQSVSGDKPYFINIAYLGGTSTSFLTTGGSLSVEAKTDYNITNQGYPAGLYIDNINYLQGSGWITITDAIGADGAMIRQFVVVVDNNSSGSPRSAKIPLRAGNFIKEILIEQQ